MKIDQELIEKLAHLSRIELQPDEKAEMHQELEKMIHFIEKLDELNTDGITPITHLCTDTHFTRKDEVQGELSLNEVFRNAKGENYFQVPKVIKKES